MTVVGVVKELPFENPQATRYSTTLCVKHEICIKVEINSAHDAWCSSGKEVWKIILPRQVALSKDELDLEEPKNFLSKSEPGTDQQQPKAILSVRSGTKMT